MSAKFARRIRKEIAKKYGVSERAVEESFSVTPTQTQTLNLDLHRGAGFLSMIDIQARGQQQGKTLKIGGQGPKTKTNNTKAGNKRRPSGHNEFIPNEYQMRKMHTDFFMHDDDVADWSEFPNYKALYSQSLRETFNQDRQIIGFHGETWVADSDLEANPLMQDVNVGWIQLLKDRNPSQILVEGAGAGTGEIKIGTAAGSDYANLDQLVHDLYSGIPMHRRGPGMTVIVGQGLLAAAEGRLYSEQGETPTEKRRIQELQVIGTYGGLPAMTADYFPENGIMITRLKRGGKGSTNLAIYYQKKSWKRKVEYQSDIESTLDWNARREAYHIKDLRGIVMALPQKIIMTSNDNFEIEAVPQDNWND